MIKIIGTQSNPKFQGPYSLSDLIKKGFSKNTRFSGIYMWGVKVNGIYYPMYVGKARHIVERLFQHLSSFSGGEYIIPDRSTTCNPNRDIQSLVSSYRNHGTLPIGLLYYPTGHFDFFTLSQNSQILQTIDFVKENFFACWKELPDYDIYSSTEEGNLAEAICKEKLISSRYGVGDRNKRKFIDNFLELNIK